MIKHMVHIIISFHSEKMMEVKILCPYWELEICLLINLDAYMRKNSGNGNQVTEYKTEEW